MFEIKTDETVSKTFRIPKRLIDKLEKLADEKKISLSKIVVQCIEYALENLETKRIHLKVIAWTFYNCSNA